MTTRVQDTLVPESGTLREAMGALQRSGLQIALVVDTSSRLVGTMTDGDIRTALLAGAQLDSALEPFVKRRFTSVGSRASRAEALDLMRALGIQAIPIVDADGRVAGLHLIREILGAVDRPNWAVVMAGGRGARLSPLTESVPKPMLRVAGRPVLERIVLHLVSYGIRRIFLAIHYLGHVIEEHFRDGSSFGCQIEYIREEAPAGSGGALALLPEACRDPLVVLNGDLVTQPDLAAMLDFHGAGKYVATLAVREYRHTVPFGCVEVSNDRVARLEEKPSLTRLINCGIYVLEPELVRRVPAGAPYPLPRLVEECIERRERVGAFLLDGDDWIDIGAHDQLMIARGGMNQE